MSSETGTKILLSNKKILRGVGLMTVTYFVAVAFRFVTSVVLSRLLAPNIMGIMVVVYTIRSGMELLSDVGLGQNIVQNKNGMRPTFYNTAWLIQIIRGIVLSTLLFLFSSQIASYYSVDINIIQIASVALLISGFSSTSLYLLQRNVRVAQLTLFELMQDLFAGFIAIIAAFISPTIYSLIIANLIAVSLRTACTYLLPDARQLLFFSKAHAREIFSFGKWIFLSSLLMFASANFDKLYLGQAAPLAMLGIYSIARAIAELPTALIGRLGYSLVFPIIASARTVPREEVRTKLSRLRRRLLAGTAVALAGGISVADFAIRLIYDQRYQDAAWMLPVLLAGAWITILASLNEFTLLGFGRPVYAIIGNCLKLIVLFLIVPFGYDTYGMLGAVVFIALADLARLPSLLVGQIRERFSFVKQDIGGTMLLLALVGLFTLFRQHIGFGTIFDSLPL